MLNLLVLLQVALHAGPVQDGVEGHGEGEHAEQGGVQVTRVVVALDSPALATVQLDVDDDARRRHCARDIGTLHATKHCQIGLSVLLWFVIIHAFSEIKIRPL